MLLLHPIGLLPALQLLTPLEYNTWTVQKSRTRETENAVR